ncbi:MAG: hypothetical protein ACTSR3_11095 [Candidatus Helarchaeota archaeon]
MIKIIIRAKWNANHEKIVEAINKIPYFSSRISTPQVAGAKINDRSIISLILPNGAFVDDSQDNKTVILFFTGVENTMEMRIQCFGNKSNDLPHLLKQRDITLDNLKEGIIKKFFINRRIKFKINREELKSDYLELGYKNVKSILGYKTIIPVYFSSLGFLVNYIIQFINNPQESLIYLIVFLITIPINLIAMFIINILGEREYAFIRV